jgi:dTDP-4-dehydrorhamnose reductase
VDAAENEPGKAFAVNALAVRDLAVICRDLDAMVIHLSSDYVFGLDATRDAPYDEDDPPGPLNVYGTSKLAGENFLRAMWPKHFIIRTCGLYGDGGANFVEAMLKKIEVGTPPRVVADQICTPTSAADLARAIIELLECSAYGVYHVTSSGACTWHEFASAIFEFAGKTMEVEAISSDQYAAAAKRPRYSVLSNRRWISAGFAPLRSWRDALASHLRT